jgi:hypothetical protein
LNAAPTNRLPEQGDAKAPNGVIENVKADTGSQNVRNPTW